MNYRVFALLTLVAAPLLAIVADSMASSRHGHDGAAGQTQALPAVQPPAPAPKVKPEPAPQPLPALSAAPAFGQPIPGAGEPMLPLGDANAQDASDPPQNASR
jgi:hypothetical protein